VKKGFGDETPTLQIDLEAYFRGFGEIEALRLRRTGTGLFKGSVIVQFKNQSDAEKYLSEPHEWDGSLLDAKTKSAWLQSKKDEEQNLPWEERRKRDQKRDEEGRFQKHFSAFKEMARAKETSKQQGRKDRDRGGRGGGRMDNQRRDRSRSPARVEDSESAVADAVTPQKRPYPGPEVEEAPSLFSNKREKLDMRHGKREAEDDLKGEAKKIKADEK
jgi:hypothetical protein